MSTVKDSVINRMAELADVQRQKMMKDGKSKSSESMVRSMVRAAKDEFEPDEVVDALLANVAERKLKSNMKQHGWSAALKHSKQGDLWPVSLDDAVIVLGGTASPFRSAEPALMAMQVNAVIDNKVAQDEAYVRSMKTLRPIQALQDEYGITAGEAMDILRERGI